MFLIKQFKTTLCIYLEKLSDFNARNTLILSLIAFFLPFHMAFSNTLIIVAAINFLATNLIQKQSLKFLSYLFYLFMAIQLLETISLIYSEDYKLGLFQIEKKLSLFILPTIIYFSSGLNDKNKLHIYWSFLIGCIVLIFYCYTKSFIFYFNGDYSLSKWWGASGLFTLDLLNNSSITHPQFGLYLSFSIIICLYTLPFSNILKYTISLFLFIIGFLISAKMFLAATTIVVSIGAIYSAKDKVKTTLSILISIIILAFLSYMVLEQIPQLRYRVVQVIQLFKDYKTSHISNDRYNYSNERLAPFICACQTFNDNMWIGVGTGDIQSSLNECYVQHNWDKLSDYDSHNQYLDYGIRIGISGITMFILLLIVPLINFFHNKNILGFSFVFVFILCCITEAMLNVNKGIVFFALFYPLITSNLKFNF